jgi:hypothetical protein
MEDLFSLLYKTLTSLFTILSVVLYTGMISRAWLWVIDFLGFCEAEGKVVKKKDGKNGKSRMGNKGREKEKDVGLQRGDGIRVVRNRRVEEIMREEGFGCECECEDCCEEEGEKGGVRDGVKGKGEGKKEEWWESWVEV